MATPLQDPSRNRRQNEETPASRIPTSSRNRRRSYGTPDSALGRSTAPSEPPGTISVGDAVSETSDPESEEDTPPPSITAEMIVAKKINDDGPRIVAHTITEFTQIHNDDLITVGGVTPVIKGAPETAFYKLVMACDFLSPQPVYAYANNGCQYMILGHVTVPSEVLDAHNYITEILKSTISFEDAFNQNETAVTLAVTARARLVFAYQRMLPQASGIMTSMTSDLFQRVRELRYAFGIPLPPI
jgi:hypothetical protein